MLIAILVVPVGPAASQEASSPTKRLGTVQEEVNRFLANSSVSGFSSANPETLEQEDPGTSESDEAARVRARLLNLPPDTTWIGLVLRSGEKVEGRSVAIVEDGFVLSERGLRFDQVESVDSSKRELKFDQVESVDFRSKNWLSPKQVPEIGTGKRVEARLIGGGILIGRLTAVRGDGFSVDGQSLTFDEVAYVRKLGMRSIYKVLIVVGAVVGTLAILGATRALCQGNQC